MHNVYTKMKVFHYKEKIESLPKEYNQILPPIHVRIKPTNSCNHNCLYCCYKLNNLQLGKDMNKKDSIPEDKMMEIIDDLAQMKVNAVTFSGGGEPFCYPYMLQTLEKLSHNHIKFASLTNGSRLNGEIAELFAHYGTWLRVSIDGWDDDSYSFYRGVPFGEYSKVLSNIEAFKKLGGKCYLGASIIIDKHNVSHIYDSVRMLKNVGVDSAKVSPCIVSNDAAENAKYHKCLFDNIREQIKRAQEELVDDNFELYDAYDDLDAKFKKTYSWCPYIQILPIIGADLNIFSCQDKAYNLDEGSIGSIKDITFKEFWFSCKSKFFQINPSIHCNHHCVANEKNRLIIEYLNADRYHLDFV